MSDLQPARPPRSRIELLIEIDELKVDRFLLLTACKTALALISKQPDQYGSFVQGAADVLKNAAAVEGEDAR